MIFLLTRWCLITSNLKRLSVPRDFRVHVCDLESLAILGMVSADLPAGCIDLIKCLFSSSLIIGYEKGV
jgi:hypothetical protein